MSKGAGAGPIATQLRPVCAQTYATPARSKFFGKQNRSRRAMTGQTVAEVMAGQTVVEVMAGQTVADKLWQADNND